MARTTIEVPMQTHHVDTVLRIMEKALAPEGYTQKVIDGETVWVKGDGVFTLSQCFTAVFTENSVFIQSWTKDAILGESNLDSEFIGRIPKKKMKVLLNKIGSVIIRAKL